MSISVKERIRETKSGFTTKTEARNVGIKREIELKNKTSLGFRNNKIKPIDINNMYLHCINDLGNSTTTVRHYHWVLSKSFIDALR